ncbi:hypothetical protein BC936DRAFT_146077 [Jimgerdemannia flammicorona]|uniref:CBS domain-containing protein n=1 Tax=Jimgerdemannia flammicorona TaxID=994334 RepID=A0A433D8G5_9FUNG|nr:hypothetical protein BC936DRAFT_146077 [Jimgerdemannia flammicorona]
MSPSTNMATPLTNLTPTNLNLAASKPLLIAASPTTTVRQVLTLMAEHNITSLPLRSHNSDAIVSIVNVYDVATYIINAACFTEINPQSLDSEKLARLDDPIENVLGLETERESYRIFKTDAHEPLYETLAAFSRGIHRSLVIDYTITGTPAPPWLLSQTDIIRYINKHPESIAALGIDLDAPLADVPGLLHPDREVVSAREDESALNVYRKMAQAEKLGIAVVDRDDNLVANLSASDLRSIDFKAFDNLILPVLEFLKVIATNPSRPLALITATPKTTLRDLVRALTENDVHRVWVVEAEGSRRLVDVVTQSDVVGVVVARAKAARESV